jgi:hypothetical protein
MVHQPNAIRRTTESETGAVHVACPNGEKHRLAVPAANLEGDFRLGREVNVMPSHPLQTVLSDAIEETCGRSVIKDFRRHLGRILQIDLNRMSLTGPNPLAILAESKSLLRVCRHYLLELIERERNAAAIHGLE